MFQSYLFSQKSSQLPEHKEGLFLPRVHRSNVLGLQALSKIRNSIRPPEEGCKRSLAEVSRALASVKEDIKVD